MSESLLGKMVLARLSGAHAALKEAHRDGIAGKSAAPFDRFAQVMALTFPPGANWEWDDQSIREHAATPLLVRYLVRSMSDYFASDGFGEVDTNPRAHAVAKSFGATAKGGAKQSMKEALPSEEWESFLDRVIQGLERLGQRQMVGEREALDHVLRAMARTAVSSDGSGQSLEAILSSFEMTLVSMGISLPRRKQGVRG